MRLGSTLLALSVCVWLGSASEAQQGDPLGLAPQAPEVPKAKAGTKPGTAKKPALAAKRGRASAVPSRSTRLRQAQALAVARANLMVMPPPSGAADPLGLANDLSGGAPNFGFFGGPSGSFATGGVAVSFGPGFGSRQTVNPGLTGTSDNRLIHGEDGDGQGELAPTFGDINHPRVDRVRGGNHIAGIGVPLRKGERVFSGNYIPGLGVTGQRMDATAGGTYTPGFGVIGSFDPRFSNRVGDQVAGGSYVPGYGIVPGGNFGANSFGAVGSSFYGASGLPVNYGAGGLLPTYGAVTNSGFYGASAVPSGFGSTIPSSYGASALPGFRR